MKMAFPFYKNYNGGKTDDEKIEFEHILNWFAVFSKAEQKSARGPGILSLFRKAAFAPVLLWLHWNGKTSDFFAITTTF